MGQLILDRNAFIDKIRFVSSGTEAVMSGVRLARGYTGKNKIVKFEGCYHGHVDSLLVKADRDWRHLAQRHQLEFQKDLQRNLGFTPE